MQEILCLCPTHRPSASHAPYSHLALWIRVRYPALEHTIVSSSQCVTSQALLLLVAVYSTPQPPARNCTSFSRHFVFAHVCISESLSKSCVNVGSSHRNSQVAGSAVTFVRVRGEDATRTGSSPRWIDLSATMLIMFLCAMDPRLLCRTPTLNDLQQSTARAS